jgi:hypothetical protein
LSSPRHPISVEEAAARDARQIAPPVVVLDGDRTEVGAAHGRVLPLIGNKRPFTYDISLPDRSRVYADTPEDAIAVIIGGDYAELLAQLRDLEDSGDKDASEQVWVELVRRRHKHADDLRLSLQQQINDLARRDRRWDALDDSERAQLESAADPEGPYPVGIETEAPFLDEDGQTSVGWQGMWFAEVPLVVNSGDYAPFSDATEPVSCLTKPGTDGVPVVVPGDPNLIRLDIADSITYLESLERCGHAVLTIRPSEQPDPIFRGISVA